MGSCVFCENEVREGGKLCLSCMGIDVGEISFAPYAWDLSEVVSELASGLVAAKKPKEKLIALPETTVPVKPKRKGAQHPRKRGAGTEMVLCECGTRFLKYRSVRVSRCLECREKNPHEKHKRSKGWWV